MFCTIRLLHLCKTSTMVSLSELLYRPELDLSALHLAAPEAPLRWVATSELADPTPFLEGGEVLLTTGLGSAGWDGEWAPYVARLIDTHACALGLAVGLTHLEAPPSLVRACRERGLNLFTVPRATRFVAISHLAADLLQAERESTTLRSFEAQRALTKAALAPDDVTSLTVTLAELLAGSAVLVDRDGTPTHGPFGPRSDDLDLALIRRQLSRLLPRGRHAAASSTDGDAVTVLRPLGLHARPEAWLAVVVPRRLDDTDRVAMSTAETLLGLTLERHREQRRTERQLRTRAIELLIADEPRTAGIVLGAATAVGLTQPTMSRRLRVLRAAGPDDSRQDALTFLEHEPFLSAHVEDELVVAVGATRASGVAQALAERGLRVGVGRTVPADRSSASHATAGHALATTTASAPIRTWDDLAVGGVVGLLGRDSAAAFATSFLAPLEDEPALLETLTAFLREHGSRGETAVRLGVHRNTVRNRVEQIESRLRRSLDDPQVRVDAWVALQVTGSTGLDLSLRPGPPTTS